MSGGLNIFFFLHNHLPQQCSVGPDNNKGHDKVQDFAAYLVSIRDGNMSLPDTQANEIIRLWNNLHEYDKRPTMFALQHGTELVKGRFKAPKSRTTGAVPGLDSHNSLPLLRGTHD